MSAITAQSVKELRERTGAGMMDCKKALTETDGDMDAAVAFLREKGLAGAAKKAGRVAAEGQVGVFGRDDGSRAVVMEFNSETDFVAKNENFTALLGKIGACLLESAPAGEGAADDVTELALGSSTLGQTITEGIASIGENLGLRRYAALESNAGRIGHYVHAGGKIGVLVDVEGATADEDELVRSLAMQVAAAFPRYVQREEVPQSEVAAEREIFKNQALGSGKPEHVVEKIVDGKVDKFYKEVCLLEQEYVRDSQLTVAKLLAEAGEAAGRNLSVKRFIRYQLGEGIEKRSENFAEEVAAQISKGA